MKALYALTALILTFLVAPIAITIVASFTAGDTIAFPPVGWSLRWYAAFFSDPDFIDSAWVSVQVALITTTVATPLGTAAAIALARGGFRGRRAVAAFLALPLGIPAIVLGLAFLVTYTQMGFGGTLWGIVAGHIVLTTPFVIRLVTASFTQFDPNLERAAAGLGASPATVLRRVTLPAIRAGIVGGAVFAAILSFDEVVVALFLSGPDATTLPVRIFTTVDQSPGPVVLAAGAVLVGIALVTFTLLEATIGVGRAFGLEEETSR
jgi:putative spermidine/putrescine transport system permease protein